MKKLQHIVALILTLACVFLIRTTSIQQNEIETLKAELKTELIDIKQDIARLDEESIEYVTYEAIQPLIDDIDEYQAEMHRMGDNLNDFNALWNALFDYEQEQYIRRGK